MTTPAAAALYLAQHNAQLEGLQPVVFNPQNVAVEGLPAIYAFSNVRDGDGVAYAMAADGTVLGSHWCSADGYVPHDLAVLAGCREDRHETYRAHYPNGYRMEHVPLRDVRTHAGLREAWRLNQEAGERHASQQGEGL